jgi:nicotinamidase-related amidase
MARGLLVIDIQRDYFPGGAYPLVGSDAAAVQARALLGRFRAAAAPVVHVKHVWDAPDATFMIAGTDGVEIHPSMLPAGDELLLEKSEPNGFVGTGLLEALRERDLDELVVVGMMSSMCVDATVRAALDLGLAVIVAHDGCAAPDLEFLGTAVPGAVVHAAFMAALGDAGATVVAGGDVAAVETLI